MTFSTGTANRDQGSTDLTNKDHLLKKTYILASFVVLTIGAPLIGVYLSDRSPFLFASFPPLASPAEHKPFSWPVFLCYLSAVLGVAALLCFAAFRTPKKTETIAAKNSGNLPWWGWSSLMLGILAWILAWTRFSWFAPWQGYTFIPLWLSYIGVINALCVRQSGSCPLLDDPVFFAGLFPLSALFWWFFEYMNQFTRNWFYTGVDLSPLSYSIHATICFSTVLPAVYSSRIWIVRQSWFKNRFHGLPPFARWTPKCFNELLLHISIAGLIGVVLWPEQLFSLIWLTPLLVLTALKHLYGQKTLFTILAKGDWRPAMSAAMAALLCGFFWEMWNYYSLAKWMYSIPSVHRFQIFEMPLLGYIGYIPFGLLCIELIEVVHRQAFTSTPFTHDQTAVLK